MRGVVSFSQEYNWPLNILQTKDVKQFNISGNVIPHPPAPASPAPSSSWIQTAWPLGCLSVKYHYSDVSTLAIFTSEVYRHLLVWWKQSLYIGWNVDSGLLTLLSFLLFVLPFIFQDDQKFPRQAFISLFRKLKLSLSMLENAPLPPQCFIRIFRLLSA